MLNYIYITFSHLADAFINEIMDNGSNQNQQKSWYDMQVL